MNSNLAEMKTAIVIITLNPNSEQVQELSSFLESQGLTFKLEKGVDGRKSFPNLEKDEYVDQKKSLKMQQVKLTQSEVGCYLSHFRTIKKAYNENLDQVCILEDDVLIEPDFKKVLSLVEKLPDEFEQVRLMGLKRHKRKNVCEISTSHRLVRPVKGLCGSQGYVLNRRGMKKILQYGGIISEPIDKFYDHFWEIDLKSYCIEPHVIWERPIIKSSIIKSSIIKASRSEATKPIGKLLKKHIAKLQRGLKRRLYIFKHWNDFFPAKKPANAMGRTARIR